MRTSRSLHLPLLALATAGAYVVVPPRPAPACGPDLPVELLSDRDDTMSTLQEGYFLEDVTHLVPAPGPPYQVVIGGWGPPPERGSLVERTLYRAGADAFHAEHRDAAAAALAFAQVLALPADLRRTHSTRAAYSLGRTLGGDEALAAYRQVRALADAGFPDDLGLAAASLGAEARILYDRAEPGDVIHALHLYAQQAALSGSGGDTSLLFVVRELATHPRLDEVLAAPLGQRLIATYLATRADELDESQRDDLWQRLAAIAATTEHMPGADQLAAAAYRRGEWDVAARFAAQADDAPRARWVRAKLAMRDGDHAAAEDLLASAAAGLTADAEATARIAGERATLALADGRVLDAMDHAWSYRAASPDAVYIAERVLTINELTGFVARVAPEPAATPDEYEDWGKVNPWLLRDILGRRLMRAGRFPEAWPYLGADHRLAAWRYATAMAHTGDADPILRAQALYDASRVARRHGLAILGTTHAPDWGLYSGEYDPYAWREWSEEPPPPRSRWMTHAEDARVAASAPPHPQRFHYRFTASALAEAAADLLPHQSQAFAVTLCRAAVHVRYRDEERVQALYARYLDDGPAYGGMDFGQWCNEPEFERARRFLPPPPEPQWPLAVIGALCGLGLILLLRYLRPGRVAIRP